jgi:hypothetical protein
MLHSLENAFLRAELREADGIQNKEIANARD